MNLLAVGIGRQERCQDRGARRNERTARPPDVKVMDRRERASSSGARDALFAECCDRKPRLNQALRHTGSAEKAARRDRGRRNSESRAPRRPGPGYARDLGDDPEGLKFAEIG